WAREPAPRRAGAREGGARDARRRLRCPAAPACRESTCEAGLLDRTPPPPVRSELQPGGHMIRSMTGYGAAEAELGGQKLSIEIHSVNHRFAEISIRLPRSLSHFENPIRTLLGQALGRGKITFIAAWEGKEDAGRRVRIDVERARRYLDDLRRMKSALKLNGDFDMNMILG